MYSINLNAVLPLRKEASETSEMVSQLLFGECCEVLDAQDSFVYITNCTDGYSGWADTKMLTEITADDYRSLQNAPPFMVHTPVAEVLSLSEQTVYRLPAGSRLPDYDPDTGIFGVGEKRFRAHQGLIDRLKRSGNTDGVAPLALQFLNVPYLWGGKTIMGIDCSGLVQLVFSLCGIFLPRDASQQARTGVPVIYEDACAGDLLFFEKNGKIVHVGIYMGDRQILHTSGKVKMSKVDKQGILSDDESVYTHFLAGVRRTANSE
ncbi:MAG: C40 family peptidase [Prevotella sp.]|jgi:hypothetical protein|nr:C40 family peptidase [Prevotella sp.]